MGLDHRFETWFFESRLQSHGSSHIPDRLHRTNPTPPDNDCSESRMNPTPPDQSNHLLPPHNPSVVGSIPTGPTSRLCYIVNRVGIAVEYSLVDWRCPRR